MLPYDLEKKLAFFIQAGVGVSGYNLENNNEETSMEATIIYTSGRSRLNYNFSTYFFIAAFCQCGGQRL